MRITKKASGAYEKMLLDYLEEFASEMLVEKINTGNKTFGGCWNYITSEAKKEAKNNCACIPDERVYGWATHYFEEEDIKEQKTGAPVKKVETSEAEQPESQTEKKEEKVKEGYIDLSDFL